MPATDQLRAIFEGAGITEAPTVTRWGSKTWTIECRAARTRRQVLEGMSEAGRQRKLAEAEAYGIDLDAHDTIRVRAHAYRRDLGHDSLTLDRWLHDLAGKIPAGYEPTGLVDSLGSTRLPAPAVSAAGFAARRHLLGLTYEELADALGVNPRTVRRWEGGQSAVKASVLGDLDRLIAEHAADAARLTEDTIPDGPRPRGWYIAALARTLDSAPDAPATLPA